MAAAALLAGCAGPRPSGPILATVPTGRLTFAAGMPVLHLAGSPYEMGYQHGSLLRAEVRASVANALQFAKRQVGLPIVGGWMVGRKLDAAWRKMEPHVPERYLDEMKGLADGAGVPLRLLQRVHAIPDLTSVTCASSAATGAATRDGRLVHIRNLDWAIQSDVQRFAALIVQRPAGRRAFVNVGWLGFVGVITGVNEAGLSVGEIGAETLDGDLAGTPMPFLLRRVLEEAGDLTETVEIVCTAPRTVGYNYLVADAGSRSAVAVETTRSRCAAFWMDREPGHPFAARVPNAIVRADWALDPEVRDRQLAAKGDPKRPGLEPPVGSGAYDIRYRGQAALLARFHGAVDPEIAMGIARAIAPESNLQSVVFAWPELWVATAEGRKPAAQTVYRRVDLTDLLGS